MREFGPFFSLKKATLVLVKHTVKMTKNVALPHVKITIKTVQNAINCVPVGSRRKNSLYLNGVYFIILNSRDVGPFLTFIYNGVFQKWGSGVSGILRRESEIDNR